MHIPQLHILLVEDHPFQLLATRCLLTTFGFTQLTLAENAGQAIALMAQSATPFDILLCDQCLPDLTGLELIIMASHQHAIHHAILLSGLPLPELKDLEAQATRFELPLLGCLSKPLNREELYALIHPLFAPATHCP